MRDEEEVLALLGSPASTCFFTPFIRELEDLQLRRLENTASRAGVNGTEVVQSGTNVPYSRDERLQSGK